MEGCTNTADLTRRSSSMGSVVGLHVSLHPFWMDGSPFGKGEEFLDGGKRGTMSQLERSRRTNENSRQLEQWQGAIGRVKRH